MSKKVVVKVPATTANLGPGFDVLGMALNLYNEVEIEESSENKIEIYGEGENTLPRDSNNLVFQTVSNFFSKVDYASSEWQLRLINRIPLSRGLGSSAAAIVGALLAANTFAGSPLSIEELLREAILLEGHPDNAAAALFGGVVAVVQEENQCFYHRFIPKEGFRVIAVVPDFELATKFARKALPQDVPLKDAIFNLGRLALLIAALNEGNWSLLSEATKDKLHQPYRCPLVPGLDKVLKTASNAGAYAAFLSGAGPTVVALAPADSLAGEQMLEVFQHNDIEAKVLHLQPNLEGAKVIEYQRGEI